MTTSSEDGSGFAVEPHAHHSAVENQPHDRLVSQRAGIPCVPVALHLAPHSAHRVLANLPTKYAAKGTPHAARIGAGKIRTGDQRVGSPGAALIIPQHLALPFRCLAAGTVQPGAWHRDLGFPERARQRANPAAMPMARNNCCRIPSFQLPGSPAIARARQSRIKLATNHLLDQSANLPADHVFYRIKPIVEKVGVGLDCRMRKFRLAGNVFHGVVSIPALQRRVIRGWSPRRLRHLQFLPTQRRDPGAQRMAATNTIAR